MLEALNLLSLGDGGWGAALLAGAGVTLLLSLACVPIGLPLGLLLAAGMRRRGLARAASVTFSTVFRGLPELLTLLLVYYGVQIAVQRLLIHVGYEGEFSLNAFVAAVVAFSLVLAAFSSEVWLGAWKTIARGQMEAAQVLGLSHTTTFFRIILPQLMRVALPGLSNNWLTLLKDSSLVSTIALVDLMRQTNLAVTATKEPIVFYFAACLLYLLLSALSGLIFTRAEKYFGRHDAHHGGAAHG